MRRSVRHAALAVALVSWASGCQDYKFNPVHPCIIQPGSERVQLSSVSSADVLFVVDDSGSMAGEQAKLALAFDRFVGSLHGYNDRRVANHLEPFDFHLAMTTTSVFYNQLSSATCQATCGSSSNVCGVVTGGAGTCTPTRVPKACPAGTGCDSGGGFACKTTCAGHAGEAICCDATGGTLETTTVACTSPGTPCGEIHNRYAFNREPQTCTSSPQCTSAPFDTCTTSACGDYLGQICCAVKSCTNSTDCDAGFGCGSCDGRTNVCCSVSSPVHPQGQPELGLACAPGIAVEGALYPQGAFVGLGSNPRVLHFDKSLYGTDANGDGSWDPIANPSTATNHQGFTRKQLKDFFAANVNVGTCGSGQEQGLQAARLAISKALEGKQRDMRNAAGTIVAAPGVTADWPHAAAKLVVVYVGDEDDCSTPQDPVRGVILSGKPPHDSCWADAQLVESQQKEFRIADLVSDLQALHRPLGAAFVVSTEDTTCTDESCTPGQCRDCTCNYGSSGTIGSPPNQCSPTSTCGGQAAGNRFLVAANALRAGGADVVEASICDPGAIACASSAQCPAGSTCSSTCIGAAGASYCCYSSGPLAGTLWGTAGFGEILARIAEIVKPPSALTLPTTPASAALTLLRITDPSGDTRKICRGPALPPLTFQEALDQRYDWWFTATADQTFDKAPSAASRYVYVNHDTQQCEPNPGEGYSADYLGVLPAGGCTSQQECADVLGTGTDWTCFAGTNQDDGTCIPPSATAVGTCLCGKYSAICPQGP